VYLDLWSMLVFIFKSWFKKVEWCWKRKKRFHDYSGTNGSLFRLWLSLLHVMLNVILIICLVVFAIAWLVSNDWDCLMSLWKNHALFLLYVSILLWFSPLMLFFGLTWRMLTPCFTLTSHHKTLWSFGFWLVIRLYALVNNVLSLCMIMAVIALLVGRSQSFASLHSVLSMSSNHASNSQKPSYSKESTINSYAWYLQAIPSKFSCATFQKTFKTLLILWHGF
jgi:hypothetical protein